MASEARATDRPAQWYNVTCPVCEKRFHLKPYKLAIDKTHYCSRACQNKARKVYMKGEGNHQYGLKKELNSSWKGGRKLSRYGYVRVLMPDHPLSEKDGTVFEHRLVAEQYLLTDETSIEIDGKKYLNPNYIVHHKNHIRTDNRPENLEIMEKSLHSLMHAKEHPAQRDAKTGRFICK